MSEEAWLSGKLDGFDALLMPAAHALVQCARDLVKHAEDLSQAELNAKPNGAPSVAFHLRHIAGSIDRLVAYAKGDELSEAQFAFLREETSENCDKYAFELVEDAVCAINYALEFCKSIPKEKLFEDRFVGRKRLQTNVFGLLFHIAEHTARHVGQVVTTAKIVRS